MPMSDLKAVVAIHEGKTIRGIYRREVGTFEVRKGAVKLVLPEFEYTFDFTVGGKRYRSVFGKESENGRIGARGNWESAAVENAVQALVRFRTNAQTGEGPTSLKEDLELSRLAAEEQRRKERREKTVSQLVEEFLADLAVVAPNIKTKKPRTIEEYRLNLHRDVIPAIGKRKAKTIDREDIAEIINKIVRRGKIVQANRTLAACSRLFNWALSRGLVLYNPCAQMKKYEERPRERVLTEPEQKTTRAEKASHAEIKNLWEQLAADESRTESRILRLCILTGARPGEVCKMRWEEIDDAHWWTVKAEETKTGVELECFLTPTALAIIGEKEKGQTGYVFPMATKGERHLPEDRLSKYIREQNSYFGLTPWQPRDLRRTFTTLTKGFGFTDVIVNKAQARTDRTVIRVHYDKRRYYEELRQLFEAVEREILRILGRAAELAKVIPLKGA